MILIFGTFCQQKSANAMVVFLGYENWCKSSSLFVSLVLLTFNWNNCCRLCSGIHCFSPLSGLFQLRICTSCWFRVEKLKEGKKIYEGIMLTESFWYRFLHQLCFITQLYQSFAIEMQWVVTPRNEASMHKRKKPDVWPLSCGIKC
jgi:hypothetical protein